MHRLRIRDIEARDCVTIRYKGLTACSPDGTRIAIKSEEALYILDATTYDCVAEFRDDTIRSIEHSLVYSPDGSRLASGSKDGMLRIWDANTGICLLTLAGHKDMICSVAYSQCGTTLASASHDKSVKVWDANTGRCVLTLNGHRDKVISLICSPFGYHKLASGSNEKSMKVWDFSTLILEDLSNASILRIVADRNGANVELDGVANALRIGQPTIGPCLAFCEPHTKLECLAFTAHKNKFAIGSAMGILKIGMK